MFLRLKMDLDRLNTVEQKVSAQVNIFSYHFVQFSINVHGLQIYYLSMSVSISLDSLKEDHNLKSSKAL